MEPGESAVTYEGHVPGMHNNWDHNSRLITGPEGLLGNRLGSEEAAHSSPPDECTRDLLVVIPTTAPEISHFSHGCFTSCLFIP